MNDVLQRLRRLESAYQVKHGGWAAFRLDNGGVFRVGTDPLSYLLKNGVDTGSGKIVELMDPPGESDPITAAVFEEINEILHGGDDIGNERI